MKCGCKIDANRGKQCEDGTTFSLKTEPKSGWLVTKTLVGVAHLAPHPVVGGQGYACVRFTMKSRPKLTIE